MEDLQSHLRKRGMGPRAGLAANAFHKLASVEEGTASWLIRLLAQSLRPLDLVVDDVLGISSVLLVFVAMALGHNRTAISLGCLACYLVQRVLPPHRQPLGLKVVCISDTHGRHRDISLPKGDILIHAGDFTKFGRREDAEDFNAWLGELDFKAKLVVNGNHENNAEWQPDVQAVLSNATFLKNSAVRVCGLEIHGTDFCWPMRTSTSCMYDQISRHADIVIAHGPARGFVDGQICVTMISWPGAWLQGSSLCSGTGATSIACVWTHP
eukprot:gnl/TRDRNA2_/TRDRNA2_83333_c0_seq2.p1 gnl/TRDRNA2_/TRDRNA2_83333_c0~~gnl/TRDRNA2_/TRDRNA2_83333_c0_seq2.p1  ORF type:complete len:288 (-),score=27.50 gnl/TRDRNA2_/TRDRNA2_83333_c0_seq2:186-989(-)